MNLSSAKAPETEIDRISRVIRAQSQLVDAVQQLSSVRTLPAIQEIVRRTARELANADGATFVLRDGEKCHYADEDAIAPLWKGQRFPMSACISGWTMLHARAVAIPDIYADSRIPADAYRPTFVKSLVMVPIRIRNPIGAIGVYWAHQRSTSEEEIGLIQALANTTSVAMENVAIYTELEQRVARRTQQLEALNQELESFSYSVSHDLRAPLRAIKGFTDLFASELGGSLSGKALHYLNRIRQGGMKMDNLILDLLKLAKVTRQDVHRIDVDLAAMAREITARLRTEEPGREVEVVVPEKITVKCDAGLIAVVMENLLSNAWKYTGKKHGARIEVGAKRQSDGTEVFFIEDNGAGFDPKKARELFTPFQRLHSAEEFPGTGVGLATVQRIIHRHGGRVWATAQVGEGATFSFTCP